MVNPSTDRLADQGELHGVSIEHKATRAEIIEAAQTSMKLIKEALTPALKREIARWGYTANGGYATNETEIGQVRCSISIKRQLFAGGYHEPYLRISFDLGTKSTDFEVLHLWGSKSDVRDSFFLLTREAEWKSYFGSSNRQKLLKPLESHQRSDGISDVIPPPLVELLLQWAESARRKIEAKGLTII